MNLKIWNYVSAGAWLLPKTVLGDVFKDITMTKYYYFIWLKALHRWKMSENQIQKAERQTKPRLYEFDYVNLVLCCIKCFQFCLAIHCWMHSSCKCNNNVIFEIIANSHGKDYFVNVYWGVTMIAVLRKLNWTERQSTQTVFLQTCQEGFEILLFYFV